MHVEAAFATNRLASSVTVHSHTRSCGEPCPPDRAKEIDFQFDRGERFLLREGARKCNANRGISNIAKNPAAQCSHAVCMCGPAAKTTVARQAAMSLASNPIRRATGMSFVFARSLKSAREGSS
jgi:hypothetical protein